MAVCPRILHDFCRPMDIADCLFEGTFVPGILDRDLFSSPAYHRRYFVAPFGKDDVNLGRSPSHEVSCTSDKFALNLDVRNFAPEEISVKTTENRVEIHAKHEEKSDDHGYVLREFTRRYALPEDVDPETVTCNMSAKGVLTLKAPRKKAVKEAKTIPIAVEHAKKDAVTEK
ncbi:alpha-crystallin A chain-like [Ornithodoros turicata]|uniref:alpha-crystallin A chain-like n=1 Tax=Ornithodoros turicata TaxID=34597 RepID=UPI00313895EC